MNGANVTGNQGKAQYPPRKRGLFTAHLSLLTRWIHVPGRGTKTVSELEFRQIIQAWNGVTDTQENLAAKLGMTKGGYHNNIEALITIGVMTKQTTRGRNGRTRLRVRKGLRFLGFVKGNVAPRVYDLQERTTTYVRRSLENVGTLIGDIHRLGSGLAGSGISTSSTTMTMASTSSGQDH